MKFTKIIMLAAVVSLACACEKEMAPEAMPDGQPKEIKSGTEMLSFASVEEMEAQVCELAAMDSEKQEAWYAAHEFESQSDALYRVAEEIESVSTLEEAQAIKGKYGSYFLFNENPADEELFNPYLPNEKTEYALVCNIKGEVMIAGQVVNYNTITDVRNTHEYQLTHESVTRSAANITETNILKRTVGKHKFWAEGRHKSDDIVSIEFTSHKKGLFGWNKCKMKYHVLVRRKNANWRSFSPDFNYYLNSSSTGGLWTREIASHTFVAVGRPKYNQNATMDLMIYSSGTGTKGEGPLVLSYTSTKP